MNALVPQAIASGIVMGSVYALIALSVVLIYKATEVINFAGGEFVMVGGYLALFAIVVGQASYVTIFLFVVATTLAGGMLFERVVLRRVARSASSGHSGMVSLVIATVGLSFALKGLVRVFPYTEEVRRLPPLFSGPPIFIGPVILQRQDVAIICIAVIIISALAWFFNYTLTGKALRATSENPRAAALIGIPTGTVHTIIWGFASVLAGVAGVLLGPKLLLTPDIGNVIILAFTAAIIGGFTSLVGCIIGGIILGLVENFVGIFISSQAIVPAPFLLIIVVLIFRPQGLFGGPPTAKKV